MKPTVRYTAKFSDGTVLNRSSRRKYTHAYKATNAEGKTWEGFATSYDKALKAGRTETRLHCPYNRRERTMMYVAFVEREVRKLGFKNSREFFADFDNRNAAFMAKGFVEVVGTET